MDVIWVSRTDPDCELNISLSSIYIVDRQTDEEVTISTSNNRRCTRCVDT